MEQQTPNEEKQSRELDEDEERYYQGLGIMFDQELADKLDAMELNKSHAPKRTGLWDEERTETEQITGTYVPEVEDREDANYVAPDRLPFDEKPMSDNAHKVFNAIFNTFKDSRIALDYLKGCTAEKAAKYTHTFVLWDANDPRPINLVPLLELLAPMKRGDVWALTTYGDVLHHTPFAQPNIFNDPTLRQDTALMEAEKKMKYLSQLNKKNARKRTELRLTELEAIVSGLENFRKLALDQQRSVQILLQLRTRDQFNHEMVDYLRENVGKLDRYIKTLILKVYGENSGEAEKVIEKVGSEKK